MMLVFPPCKCFHVDSTCDLLFLLLRFSLILSWPLDVAQTESAGHVFSYGLSRLHYRFYTHLIY